MPFRRAFRQTPSGCAPAEAWVRAAAAAGAAVFAAGPLSAPARDFQKHPGHDNGWSGEVSIDYDGSRSRTSAYHLGGSLEYGSKQSWISLSLDEYGDPSSGFDLRENTYATLEVGYALHRNNKERLYLNAMLEAEPHSLLASRGWDLSPALGVVWGVTPEWWIGAEAGAVLATGPDDGNRMGYPSLAVWTTWLCGFTPSGGDAISLGVWTAGNEIPGDDNALFVELEYSFDLTDELEMKLGLGTDPVSPWDHEGVYFSAGLTWSF